MAERVNLDFFAVKQDFKCLLEFIWQETDLRVAESYSAYDNELRWFDFFEDIETAYPIGDDPYGAGKAFNFALWSRAVMPTYRLERISLDPKRVKGHTHRYRIAGAGLLFLATGGKYDSLVTPSYMSHMSERRALVYGAHAGVDWAALAKLGRKIDYHVRERLAVAKTKERSVPILDGASKLVMNGAELREGRGAWKYTVATTPAA